MTGDKPVHHSLPTPSVFIVQVLGDPMFHKHPKIFRKKELLLTDDLRFASLTLLAHFTAFQPLRCFATCTLPGMLLF